MHAETCLNSFAAVILLSLRYTTVCSTDLSSTFTPVRALGLFAVVVILVIVVIVETWFGIVSVFIPAAAVPEAEV